MWVGGKKGECGCEGGKVSGCVGGREEGWMGGRDRGCEERVGRSERGGRWRERERERESLNLEAQIANNLKHTQ